MSSPTITIAGRRYPFPQKWEDAVRLLMNGLEDHTQAIAALAGKSDASVTSLTKQVNSILTGGALTQDQVPDGSNFGRVNNVALTANQVDLSKAGTVGLLPSIKSAAGIQLNSTNFATVDSFDAGASATVRVYGPSGAGTDWTRQVGSITQGPFASADITGLSYSTTYIIMFDGNQYYAYTTLPPSLDDSLIYVGTLTTVPSSGGTTATASPVMGGVSPNEFVQSVNITNGGSGYTSAPGVSFSGGGGTGAAGYAQISGDQVVAVIVTNGGSGYSSDPSVAFVGGTGGTTGGGGNTGGTGGSGGGKYSPL